MLYRPSTAATLNLAAAAAQGARLFVAYDRPFAERLLAAARTAYAAAKATPALYAPAADGALDPNPGSGPYDDRNVADEFYWAAAELYLTTGEAQFANDVTASPQHTANVFPRGGFSWGNVAALGRLDLATVPNALPDRARVRASVLAAADAYLADQAAQPFGQPYAPSGNNYGWGSNSSILNNLQVIGTAYDLSGDGRYRDAVLRGVDYLLGRNALNRSYVTGYGEVDTRNQHSRMYAHQLDPTLPNPPAGTVSGGPNSTAASSGDPVAVASLPGCTGRAGATPAQFCFIDDIGSWSTNEITVNWNAPMSWVSSFVADQDTGGPVQRAACTVRFQRTGSWSGGFGANVVLTNTGATPLAWSSLQWSFVTDQAVTTSWGGSVTQTAADVAVVPAAYNSVLQPGKSVTIGLNASSAWAGAAPEQFRVNGLACG